MQNKVYGMLGLAEKSRGVRSGEFMTEKMVKSGEACLVIVAGDASDNTKKEFRDMCSFYKVPYYEYGNKLELAHAMGKEMRASLAVTNEGIAKSLMQYLD